jgi:putative ABC transport system substrate-binding protein
MIGRRNLAGLATAFAATGIAHAQRGEPLKLTWVSLGQHPFIENFRVGLREQKLVEGSQYILSELHASGSDPYEVVQLARTALPTTQLFVASGGAVAHAIRQVTDRVPIIGVVSEPVALGLAQSFARPGGNYTGVAIEALETGPKSLELLKHGFPGIERVMVLIETTISARRQLEAITKGATSLGMELIEAPVMRPEDIEAAAAIARAREADSLLVPASPFFSAHGPRLVALAETLRIPAMFEHRAFARLGALLCYGPDIGRAFRRLASYVERIRKGESPADIPIETYTQLELVLNRRTARAQHLVVSAELMARADEVIE